jgi:virginiamycin A acetyltransferase
MLEKSQKECYRPGDYESDWLTATEGVCGVGHCEMPNLLGHARRRMPQSLYRRQSPVLEPESARTRLLPETASPLWRTIKGMCSFPMTSTSEPSREARAIPWRGLSSATFRAAALLKAIVKGIAIAVGMAVVALPAITARVERFFTNRDSLFLFWGQAFALLPGVPGIYIRKSYYFFTLQRCSLNCEIGFLTFIHDRRAQIGRRVYVGTGVGIGWAVLGDGCLLASRVSILSGRVQHQVGSDGRLTPFERNAAELTRIGEETWIGEGAIVMADVEGHCIVGAGSIVTKPIPAGSVVAGNPARLIRQLVDQQHDRSTSEGFH